VSKVIQFLKRHAQLLTVQTLFWTFVIAGRGFDGGLVKFINTLPAIIIAVLLVAVLWKLIGRQPQTVVKAVYWAVCYSY